MKHWFSRFDVFPTRRRLASFTIMAGRKAMASLMKHGFSTTAGTPQRKVAILGAAGGIGQPLGLLPKLNPLVSQLALYDIAGRMGVSADISNANKRAEGISTFHPNFQVASDGSEQPVRSPLMQAPTPTAGNTLLQAKAKVVRAVLKKINQSPKKVGLVAKLVRGMRADDALMQLTVLPKRAAKTVYKVVHSARANAIHNNGLDSARLIVAEAFVGKGVYSKRLWIHGRGKHGVRTRRTCRLTVVLKEMSPAEEAELAKTRVIRFQEQRAHKAKASKLFPHRLIETRWNPQRNLIRKRSPLSPLRTVKGFT